VHHGQIEHGGRVRRRWQGASCGSVRLLTSVLGGLTLVAGFVAISGGSTAALATLTATMVALWALATIRHGASHSTP
jgi:VIT1/CCC1 family predicted Fe2+/Mn2+ transporter